MTPYLGYSPQHRPECHGYWNVMNDTYVDCDCIIAKIAKEEPERLRIHAAFGIKAVSPEWITRLSFTKPTEMVVKRRKIGWFNWIPQWFRKARK